MISTVGEIYTGKARSNQDLELVGWQHLPDWKWQEQSPQIQWLDQGTVKACCNLDAKYKTERTSYLLLLFLLCWGYGWTRGREKDLCVWLLGPLLTFDSSNIHSLKDNDSPEDTRQPGPNLLNQTLEALTFLSLASNTFKSSSYALKSSGKHRLEAWMQFQRMEEKRIYREMGNSMGKNIPWVIKEEVEIPKGEESWRHWSL